MNCQVVIQVGCDDTSNEGGAQIEKDFQTGSTSQRRDPKSALVGLRDGLPTGATSESDNQNAGYTRRAYVSNQQDGDQFKGTETIPENQGGGNDAQNEVFYLQGRTVNAKVGIEYGMHENYWMYERCKKTERNKGLFLADQKVSEPQVQS